MQLNEWLTTEIGQDIWKKKYQFENETLEEWFDRVSAGNEEVKQAIKNKKFLFAGRILANRGLHKKGKKVTYSNCYVLAQPEDTIESIFQTATEMARTFSYGGGVGIDISKLSPKGAKVNNAAKNTSGSVSFMDLYSLTTELIGQNGRRGAAMISIDCKHPDLLDFIEVKKDLNKVTKANISIRITDDFMNAVLENQPWKMSFTREKTGEVIEKVVNAKEIFDKICENNWEMAEPGMLFWDRIEQNNIFANSTEIKYAGVNPCAEEPLPAYGSCLLASLNLSEFVGYPFEERAYFSFEDFKKHVRLGVRALNDILDEGLELHPLKEQQEIARNLRQIGLGLFGFHDALIKLGFKYGEEDSLVLANSIGKIFINEALKESARLAKEFGSYPAFKLSDLNNKFIKEILNNDTFEMISSHGLRNSQILTIAPTGSVATMLGISNAVEPIFALSYSRKTESLYGQEKSYKIFPEVIKQWALANNLNSEDLEEGNLPDYFNCASTITYQKRIEMQAIWQKYIDASISSTVNLPEQTTKEQVQELYLLAWKKGLKGITIYRDNCSRTGILTTSKKQVISNDNRIIKAAPIEALGKVYKLMTGCGNAYFCVNWDKEGNIIQTFTNKGSSGNCRSNQEAVSRLISQSLRAGIPLENIIDQLKSVDICPAYAVAKAKGKSVSPGSSCPYAMALVLEKAMIEGKQILGLPQIRIKKESIKAKSICENCGEPLEFSGGCITCRLCSFSKCN